MGRGLLVRFQAPTRRSKSPECARRDPAPAPLPPPTPRKVRAGTHRHPFQRDPKPAPPSPAAALPFMVTEETHRQPGSSARPRKFALSSGHCAPMAAAPRVGRLRSSPPPRRRPALPARRSEPRGRRARRSPRAGGAAPASAPPPGPPGRAGPRARAPLAPSRARPALAPALAPAQSLSRLSLSSPALSRFFFPLDQRRDEVSWAV